MDFTVFGNFKFVIYWENDRGSLNSSTLDSWKSRTKTLVKVFNSVSISHIYWIQNCEADQLSKEGCSLDPNMIKSQFFDSGILQGVGHIMI